MWGMAFESQPDGDSPGSITANALRETKLEFYNRFITEHEVVDAASDQYRHKAGWCSVVGMADTVPVSNLIEGALQWDKAGKTLYYDTGAAMVAVSSRSHSYFSLAATATTAHTQYLLWAGTGQTVTNLTAKDIVELDVTTASSTHAMARVFHVGTDAGGGAQHEDESFVRASADLVPVSVVDIAEQDITVAAGTAFARTLTLARRAFWPAVISPPSGICPLNATSVASLAATSYIPVFAVGGTSAFTVRSRSLT